MAGIFFLPPPLLLELLPHDQPRYPTHFPELDTEA